MLEKLWTPAAAPLHFASDDLDEVREHMDGHNGTHWRHAHRKGPVGFRLSYVQDEAVKFAWCAMRAPRTIRGAVDTVSAHVTLAGLSRYRLGRREVESVAGDLVILPAHREMTIEAVSPRPTSSDAMKRTLAIALAALAAGAGPALATADGPDFFVLEGGPAPLRFEPTPGSPAILTLPKGATCLRNFGCRGGISLEEFQALSPAERERRDAANPRWCRVEQAGRFGWVEGKRLAEGSCTSPKASAPTFDCRKVKAGSIEEQVCNDPELSALDRRMAVVYAAALKKASNEKPPVLKAMQRGWVKGRNDCWKEKDTRACIKESYVRGSAELEAKYRLVPVTGPERLACNGNPANEVTVFRFLTDPPTLIAERGDESSLMFRQGPAKDGVTTWIGRNESLREQGGTAKVVWGYQAPEMTCQPSK